MTNWQTKKLGDVMDFVPTGAHSRNDMTSATDNPNQVFNIHYGDIHTKYFTYVNLDKDTVPVLIENTVRDNMRLQDGDLVVADASEDYDGVGSSVELRNVRNRKVIGGLHTFALRSKNAEFAPGFTGLMLKNPATHKRLMQMSVYSKVYGLTKSSIASVDVSYPKKPEQQRIVGVLEVWDEYIEKLEQKIALKEQLKKGLMQQLLTGKRRMPGFSGEWDSISLGDLVSITTGRKDVNQGNPTGAYPFFTCSRNHTYSDEYSFDTEAILIAGNGDVGHCKYYMGKFEAYQRTYVLTNFNKVSAQYIFPFLRHYFQHFIESQKQMGAMPFIKVGMLRDFKIALPKNRAEQDVISKIIKSTDDEIDLLNKKLRETRLQKKYLLKNLITGAIRTPEDLKPLDTTRLERSAL